MRRMICYVCARHKVTVDEAKGGKSGCCCEKNLCVPYRDECALAAVIVVFTNGWHWPGSSPHAWRLRGAARELRDPGGGWRPTGVLTSCFSLRDARIGRNHMLRRGMTGGDIYMIDDDHDFSTSAKEPSSLEHRHFHTQVHILRMSKGPRPDPSVPPRHDKNCLSSMSSWRLRRFHIVSDSGIEWKALSSWNLVSVVQIRERSR